MYQYGLLYYWNVLGPVPQSATVWPEQIVGSGHLVSLPGSVVSPRDLKRTIDQFAPQFAGYEQHDAQELREVIPRCDSDVFMSVFCQLYEL